MVAKLFITKLLLHKSNIITKKSKFVVYKINDDLRDKNALKLSKDLNYKKIIKFKVIYPNQNQILKIVKNHKCVYENNIRRKENLNNSGLKKSFTKNINNKRRSSYRGVSKNGNKWQVLLMKNKTNCYFGNFQSEKIAAKLYDFFTIKIKGNNAITNFFNKKD